MIKTRRLLLRPWRPDDLPALAALLGDADVMEFSDAGPLSEDEQQDWLRRAVGARDPQKLPLSLAIAAQGSGDVLGYLRLASDPSRVGPKDAELGFRLIRSAWGQGLATEAVEAAIEVATDLEFVDRIAGIVDPSNRASVNVLRKAGLTQVGEVMLDGYTYPDHLYARAL